MLQLLKLEAIIGSSDNWKLHLDAAVELFKQMVEGHDGNQFVSPLQAIQEQMVDMPDATRPPPSMGRLSNAHQASFRFSVAILLYNDIVSSTVLGQSPRLRRYHSDLLGAGTTAPPPGMLQLEEFVGCQNWALLQVGAVAALDAWKMEMLDNGDACELDLHERARAIDATLISGLADLDSAERLSCPSAAQTKAVRENTMNGTVLRHFRSSDPALEASRILSTRIWAWSARAYLGTVVHGWQPRHPEIQTIVAQTISLFRQVHMAPQMATLIWPLCITACLATEEEESVFRQFIDSLQGLQKLGIMRDVLGMAETVWKSRNNREDAGVWTIRACLSCLGHRALLA
jgi:C6 transcription factor Pro1